MRSVLLIGRRRGSNYSLKIEVVIAFRRFNSDMRSLRGVPLIDRGGGSILMRNEVVKNNGY